MSAAAGVIVMIMSYGWLSLREMYLHLRVLARAIGFQDTTTLCFASSTNRLLLLLLLVSPVVQELFQIRGQ